MKILVFSDWHLDVRDPLGWFGWDEALFIEHLQACIRRYQPDKIILNGDIFELYRYRMAEIARSYPDLLRFLARHSVVFIRGNHDSVSHKGLDYYDIRHKDKKILVIHGHQGDFLNGNPVMRAIASMGMKIMRLFSYVDWMRNLYITIYKKVDTKPLDHRKENDFKYLYYALRILDHRYDAVIMGHTHHIEAIALSQRGKKKYYLNTGTCSKGRFQGVFLDVEKWEYELINTEANGHSGQGVP